jgi:hypothetical protein
VDRRRAAAWHAGAVPSAETTEALYAAFAAYPRRAQIEGCPCCVAAADQLPLHRVPLRKLTADDLGRFAWKAMTTWGDAQDYRHFLPRILELSLADNTEPGLELGLIASKLEYGGFAEWPAPERTAVAAWLREAWAEGLETLAHRGLLDLAIALEPVIALDELLAIWSRCTATAAVHHLADALGDISRLRRTAARARIEPWLFAPERRAALETAFAADPSDELAYAIDLWELMAAR